MYLPHQALLARMLDSDTGLVLLVPGGCFVPLQLEYKHYVCQIFGP